MISVIIPAHDEAGYIGTCLEALLASRDVCLQVIVVANACTDATAALARRLDVTVIETPAPGKLHALNLGDAHATGEVLAYLDADVVVSPDLMARLETALAGDRPRYASGSPVVTARSAFSRAYARFWSRLPFVAHGVPGFGLFAVNRAGRTRWNRFPDIISDDMFVRLSFAPDERVRVADSYHWPIIEGFANLVRVRRRQDRGVQQIARHFPHLMQNEDAIRPRGTQVLAMALRDPAGFAAYALVRLAVRTPYAQAAGWARGR